MNNITTFLGCYKKSNKGYLSNLPIELIKLICKYAIQLSEYNIDLQWCIASRGTIWQIGQLDLQHMILLVGSEFGNFHILVFDIKKQKIIQEIDTGFNYCFRIMKFNKVYLISCNLRKSNKMLLKFSIFNLSRESFTKYSGEKIVAINHPLWNSLSLVADETNKSVYTYISYCEKSSPPSSLFKLLIEGEEAVAKRVYCHQLIRKIEQKALLDKMKITNNFTRNTYANLELKNDYINDLHKIIYYKGLMLHIVHYQFIY